MKTREGIMKKTKSSIWIIMFAVTLSIGGSLNKSCITFGLTNSNLQGRGIQINEPSVIKTPYEALKLLKEGNERFQKDQPMEVDLSSEKQ